MYEFLFAAFIAVGVFAGIGVFAAKELIKSAVYLAVAFAFGSLALLAQQLSIIVFLQLFILIGGLSTYLIVSVSAEGKSKVEHADMTLLLTAGAVILLIFAYMLFLSANPQQQGARNIYQVLYGAFNTYLPFIFFIILLLFSTAIGSTLIMKKVVGLVV